MPRMPPQALVVYFLIAVLSNALLAALDRLRLLASAAWLGDLTNALCLSGQGIRYAARGSSGRSTGCCEGVLQLLMPFVKKGLIEGVYGSSAEEVPFSEALQKTIEKMGVWVSEAEPHEAAFSTSPYIVWEQIITSFCTGRAYRWTWAEGLQLLGSAFVQQVSPFQVKCDLRPASQKNKTF